MSNKKKRNTVIDFAKGATILLMLFDHIYSKGNFITSFHMPLFFIISGYFYKDEPIKVTLIKKIKKLLVPFFVIELVCILTEIIIYIINGATKEDILQIVKDKGIGLITAQNNHLTWFLMTLFLGYMIYALIYRIVGKHKILYVIFIVGISFAGYLISDVNVVKPYQIDVSMIVVIYIAIGHIFKKYGEKFEKKWKYIILFVSLPIWIIGIYMGGLVIALRFFPYYPYCIIQSAAGVFCMMFLYSKLDKIPYLNYAMRWYGRNTIVILSLGTIFRNAIGWTEDYPISNTFLSFMIQLLIITMVVVLWNYFKKLLERIKNKRKQSKNGVCT